MKGQSKNGERTHSNAEGNVESLKVLVRKEKKKKKGRQKKREKLIRAVELVTYSCIQ